MSFLVDQAANQQTTNELLSGIERLERAIRDEIAFKTRPTIFLKSNNNNLSSNFADGLTILDGPRVPPGFRGVVEDFNVNFTTAAGTVRIVILDASGQIITDVLRDISSTTNGTGRTVLDEGNRLAIVGQTAGAGTFSVYCTGFLQKIGGPF